MSRAPSGRPWRRRVSLSILGSDLDRARAQAQAEGRSLSGWVERAIEGALMEADRLAGFQRPALAPAPEVVRP